jgi:arsenite-transporting ATPase
MSELDVEAVDDIDTPTGIDAPDYVLYGGKGGVGKTTCAAATALKSARAGESTLVVSTDPAHSLSDVFDAPVGSEPTRLEEGIDLWAVEVDPRERVDRYRGQVSAALGELEGLGISIDESDLEDVFEAGMAPGADEAAAMDLFVDYADDPRFERIVFDTAPTGHTLRLLDLPDVAGSAIGELAAVRSQVSSLADSVRGFLGTGGEEEEPDADPDIDLEELRERMDRVAALLRDSDRTAFRVVLLPETMAIRETERLLARLESREMPVGHAVVNRVIEEPTPGCDRCQSQYGSQRERIEEIEDRFDLPTTLLPEYHGELRGVEALGAVADRL